VESFVQQDEHWLFYTSVLAERLTRPNLADALLLGGDSGLRGYPLRYQSGLRKVLATIEQRYYTDIYAWRLFRVGAAAFVDVGRAWDSYAPSRARDGWLSDAGVGLRIVNTRTAYGNVIHMDVAMPLNASADIRKVQFLVKTKTSF
jgi:outer membrane translocation and assembly module TamA